MQTFLPYGDFQKSASVLDYKRLGKQRVEAKQIITALELDKGWINHPTTKMWKGYTTSLVMYGLAVCTEWKKRGYVDNLTPFFQSRLFDSPIFPPWFGDERFHSSHRAALLAKNPVWYQQFNWHEKPQIQYWWPTKELR